MKNITKKGKIKLGTLADMNFAVSLGKMTNYEFSATVGYWLGKAASKINSAAKEYDATRIKALKKYAKLNPKTKEMELEEGKAIFIEDDAKEKFNAELKELHEQMVDCLLISSEEILNDAQKEKLKIPGSVWAGIEEILF